MTISNGKPINDGDRIAAVCIAFPGLQEDLAISKEKLDIPDYVEISADVENFEMGIKRKAVVTEATKCKSLQTNWRVSGSTGKRSTVCKENM